MARSRRSRNLRRSARDPFAIATPQFRVRRYPVSLLSPSISNPPGDRRRFHFDRFKPAFADPRTAARIGVAPAGQDRRQTKAAIRFDDPRRVMVCVRRKQRREVLFAAGVGGSKKRKRKPRRTVYSSISCK